MTMNKKFRVLAAAGALCMCVSLLGGCVNQKEENTTETSNVQASEGGAAENVETLLEIDDPEEKAAVEAAKKKVLSTGSEPRIIATSPATADICDKLNLDLVGVCSSSISSIPERYADAATVGGAMSPDMEIVASLDPDWILSPASLQSAAEI